MDAFASLISFGAVLAILVALAIASAAWGVDSRPSIHDDHAR
jgi:hypothetical protein